MAQPGTLEAAPVPGATGPTGERATIEERAPRRRPSAERLAAAAAVLALLGLALWSLASMQLTWDSVGSSLYNAANVLSTMDPISLPPIGDLLHLIGLTLGIVVLGTLMASVLSVPLAVLGASTTSPAAWLRAMARGIGVLCRAVPDVVLALAFALAFTLGSPLPGILAIGIHSIGMISKMFADAIEQADDGPRLAVRAAGGGRLQEFCAGVLPQVLPSWIATMLHRFDINLRGSAILGYAGVGGLGYAMRIAFEDFPAGYGRGLGIALVIFAMCVVLEIVSSAMRRMLLGGSSAGRGLGDRITGFLMRRSRSAPDRDAHALAPDAVDVESMMRRPWTAGRVRSSSWALGAIAFVVLCWFLAEIRLSDVSWDAVGAVLRSFWPPSLGTHTMGEFAGSMLETVQLAAAAALLSLVLSLVIGSLAARTVASGPRVRAAARVVLVVFRGIPELVLAIFLIMITGLGNQAGVIALAIGGVGLLGKLIADGLEEVPEGPQRALTAAGAGRAQRFAASTWPMGLPTVIGSSLYLLDTNIRAATLLGIVGAGGIGFHLTNASTVLTLHGQVTTLVAMIVVTVLLVEALSAWLRHVLR